MRTSSEMKPCRSWAHASRAKGLGVRHQGALGINWPIARFRRDVAHISSGAAGAGRRLVPIIEPEVISRARARRGGRHSARLAEKALERCRKATAVMLKLLPVEPCCSLRSSTPACSACRPLGRLNPRRLAELAKKTAAGPNSAAPAEDLRHGMSDDEFDRAWAGRSTTSIGPRPSRMNGQLYLVSPSTRGRFPGGLRRARRRAGGGFQFRVKGTPA